MHKANKTSNAFTLLEMCLLLCVISVLLLLSPSLFKTKAILYFDTQRIAYLIKQAQAFAILERREVDVEVVNKGIYVDQHFYNFAKEVVCDPYIFYFNAKGNINMANTITCYYHHWQTQIVMNLGSGHIYVKK
ncbi:MAG: hypothetical protein EOM11_05715 [Erysipelotrichia bacterium]|nr:hypothetical protein [Erysipelotrichia bacterium]